MHIHNKPGESSQSSYEFYQEQREEIVKGLQSGNRLAYDTESQKFVSLSAKSQDPRYIQDLNFLIDKVAAFIENGRGEGLVDQDIRQICLLAAARSHNLNQRISGIRGWFKSTEAKTVLKQKSQALATLAQKIDTFINYLDENRLIGGTFGDGPIESRHQAWYLNQGIYLSYLDKVDASTRQQLALAMVHGYSKGATLREADSKRLDIQTSPLLPQDDRYHRSIHNQLLQIVNIIYAQDLQVSINDVCLINSPLIREVFERAASIPGAKLDVATVEQFDELIDLLLEKVNKDQLPESLVMIEITRLLAGKSPKDIYDLTDNLKIRVRKRVDAFQAQHGPNPSLEEKVLAKLQPYAIVEHKGCSLLLAPPVSQNLSVDQSWFIDELLSLTGFYLSPDQVKAAWLAIEEPRVLFKKLNLPTTQLATSGTTIPTVCADFRSFLEQPVVKKFKDLSSTRQAAPYVQILPKATVELLMGLEECVGKGSIDTTFQEKGITDLLQISYFRMLNAMNEAILRQGDLTAFNNQIELIHQEIQMILTIVEPYQKGDFAESIIANLKRGTAPLITSDVPEPHVHLKPSAVRCISSTLAGIEAQKGDNHLQVAVLKDSYYESVGLVAAAPAYQLSTLDGDRVETDGIEGAFGQVPPAKLDVLVCEFHHNISLTRQHYQPEDITSYVKQLVDKQMVAEHFTVVIDTTINLEQSDDLRSFLHDPQIKALIDQGKLNVVFVRSGQKFDMLGMDNYYGGIAISINNSTAFNQFNTRMDHPQDQLEGLSYQGMTHLEKYGGTSIEAFRAALMESTHRFYENMPPKMIYNEGGSNPIQISKIDDPHLVFLDIKFPGYPKSSEAFSLSLDAFCAAHRLPLSHRSSFGFATTNVTLIGGGLEALIRINPGLENEAQFGLYIAFMQQVQQTIDKTLPKLQGKTPEECDTILAERLAQLSQLKLEEMQKTIETPNSGQRAALQDTFKELVKTEGLFEKDVRTLAEAFTLDNQNFKSCFMREGITEEDFNTLFSSYPKAHAAILVMKQGLEEVESLSSTGHFKEAQEKYADLMISTYPQYVTALQEGVRAQELLSRKYPRQKGQASPVTRGLNQYFKAGSIEIDFRRFPDASSHFILFVQRPIQHEILCNQLIKRFDTEKVPLSDTMPTAQTTIQNENNRLNAI